MREKHSRRSVSTWIAAIILAAFAATFIRCGGKGPPGNPGGTVIILAAASTADALGEASRTFQAETGVAVKVVPGASNTLAAQILSGAPADLFLSASEEWAREVAGKGKAAETAVLLGNDLVIAVPKGNPAGVKEPADLLGAAVIRVALAGEKVPAGRYAEGALGSLGLYEKLIASGKAARGADVRVTLGYVERRECEAGIVYATDAAASGSVEVAYRFDPKLHEPIRYPLVLLESARSNEAARKFHAWLRTPAAGAFFAKGGFQLPGGAVR